MNCMGGIAMDYYAIGQRIRALRKEKSFLRSSWRKKYGYPQRI